MHTFEYDAFQKRAIQAIDNGHSVFVAAPTGSGKTAIAEYAIEHALLAGESVVYTAPIKAISNQKYRDFGERFPGKVGLLTGDVAIEPDAPLLIVTTEIYRNQLFESPDRHQNTRWAIFDEVHYLDDYERGTVWEESLMFSHANTRILALSASVPNADEFAAWIESIHPHPMEVISEKKRPVKLVHHYQCQNLIFSDIQQVKKQGYHGLNFWSRRPHRGPRRYHHRHSNVMTPKPNRLDDLLNHLIQKDRLPCIYFAFGRKRVEELASMVTQLRLMKKDKELENMQRFDEIAGRYDLDKDPTTKKMRHLVSHGIAYHHAGLIPALKEVVEIMFTEKRLKLIFTTETFALGINMPARTVVFDELRKFYGFGFDHLKTRDFYQMAGRAGRRGLDKEGYVYSRISPQSTPHNKLMEIVLGQNEPVHSQFNASYATLLSLYKQLGEKLLDVYPRSFHYYQSNNKHHRKAIREIENKIQLLKELKYIDNEKVTDKGEFSIWMHGYELMLGELWESGYLDSLDVTELCVVLAALVYEPRKNDPPAKVSQQFKPLVKMCQKIHLKIRQHEYPLNIHPFTTEAHFQLNRAIEAWVGGCTFQQLAKHIDIDDGAIIRYFRMVTQLLRQLRQDPGTDDELRKKCAVARQKVNRDVVDAEAFLKEQVQIAIEENEKKNQSASVQDEGMQESSLSDADDTPGSEPN